MEEQSVRLRPMRAIDLAKLRTWATDPETMRFWGQPTPLLGDDAFSADLEGRFARFDTAGYLMIEDERGEAVGRIEWEKLSMRTRSAEVMILLGEAAARGRGVGSAAMIALLHYLFGERNLNRVALTTLAWNTRAIRSYEKVGFVTEGRLRDDLYFGGAHHDQLVMSILAPEFAQRWGPRPTDAFSDRLDRGGASGAAAGSTGRR